MEDALECHLARTHVDNDPPDYSSRCGTEELVDVEGLAFGGSDCADGESNTCSILPSLPESTQETICSVAAVAVECPLACGLCSV